ncbi:MAG: dTMP kinase [Tenuifilum sp.]|jgi:dTMP kinase|uniref:dTMP kinase n=1 Tax=Tenuifilum sp. TaxID=2760880 RepID=UPI0024AA1602|nr:dTMP kinase [Tenuifilum sp.]MDI3528068.1 dTMP kinase [Tenuifilum sp.]
MALIVIEGLDGAGKSTQIDKLTKILNDNSIPNHFLHFPRVDTPFFGELIARFLRGDLGDINSVDPYVVALLYATDRMDAAAQIKSWLDKNHVVLLDRYVYSNVAFQCAKLKNDDEINRLREWILMLEFEYFDIPKPDLNIFLNVPFEFTRSKLTQKRIGDSRSYLNGKDDIHEKDLEFQRRVRRIYLEQEKNDANFVVLNCDNNKGQMLPPDDISTMILKEINKRKLLNH